MEEATAAAAIAEDDDDGADIDGDDDDEEDEEDGAPMGRRWREPLEGGEDIVSWLLSLAVRVLGGKTYHNIRYLILCELL
jgi:hypothetical protein